MKIPAWCTSAALVAAASSAAAQDFRVPPYQGIYQPQGVDERGLWMEADEAERGLRDSDLVIRDQALNAYLREVLCRTVGEDRCNGVRIYIIRMPAFNASMTANGTMRVFSGLLLRVRNEAELASALAHEFAHFERRHVLTGFQRRRSASDLLMWTAVLSAVAGQPNYAYLPLVGGVFEFSRDQEREADILGLAYLKRSRYRPQCAADVWKRLMDEADASALGRAQRSQRYDRVPFFASHPTQQERAGYLSSLAGAEVADRTVNADTFAVVMRPWIAQFLDDQIRLNDFGGTEYLLAQLAGGTWTAELLHARGELYRSRGNPRDLVHAADFYRQSVALDPSRAEAYRGLGLALMRARVLDEGRAALVRYLSMQPDARDAPMIRALIDQPL